MAGLLIGAWGGGALLGSLAALRLPSRLPPLTVASLAELGQALPLWLLARRPAAGPAAVAVLGLAGLANGIRVPPRSTANPAPVRWSAKAAGTSATSGGRSTV